MVLGFIQSLKYYNILDIVIICCSCECLAGFDGPRCQVTKQGFDGTGYAIYEPLQQCENSLTSIEIITTKADGLILYSGPVTTLDPNAPQDFMYLQLAGGYPELVMDHGSGSVTLTLNGRDSKGVLKMSSLNDGKWHKIDIRRQGKVSFAVEILFFNMYGFT